MTGFRAFVSRQLRRARRLTFPRLRRPDLLTGRNRESAVDILYRLLLARPIDDAGREHYRTLMARDDLTLREIAVELAATDELQERLQRRVSRRFFEPPNQGGDGFVDVRTLMRTRSLEQLSAAADDYYRRSRGDVDRYHAKPLASVYDAPDLLGSFAHLLGGLHLARGMDVLDFGAGTGWTTRFLTQLGCRVTSVDVSPTALEIGQELFTRLPPVGEWSPPRFVVFDGRRFDIESESVDRIVCVDAFHHVPNPDAVLAELARVLRPGGIAGFSEPGPHHSASSQSQYEMKNYTVVENDIVLPDIWSWAAAAGFTKLEVAVFSTQPHLISLEHFDDLMAGGPELDTYGDRLREYLSGHNTFFLHKGGTAADSRDRRGLRADLEVRLHKPVIGPHEQIRGLAMMRNIGSAAWLGSDATVGAVTLGVHLRTRDGQPVAVDFAHIPLPGPTPPGGVQRTDFSVIPPPPGEYTLEFDLVSEGVAWFESTGSRTVNLSLTVRSGRDS